MWHPRVVLAGCGVTFLLLCVFCIGGHAATMSAAQPGHLPPPAPAVVAPPAMENALQSAVDAELSQGSIKFSTGKAVLDAGGQQVLDRLAALLKESPAAKMEIVGHADAVGSGASNQTLSEARAESVKRYLIEHGVSAERLTARGEGEEQPLGDNATEAGRQLNRRIDFRVR
jgi:outer membrane protein OmpA-like peptidoglycan-associated protein